MTIDSESTLQVQTELRRTIFSTPLQALEPALAFAAAEEKQLPQKRMPIRSTHYYIILYLYGGFPRNRYPLPPTGDSR